MSLTSKTGLLASPGKRIVRIGRPLDVNSLAPCAVTRQAQFSLRPFGGLYNPYSRGCSILCNHPASLEIRNVVKQAKEAWIIEGKAFCQRDDPSVKRTDATGKHGKQTNFCDLPEHVPEEFFRRYTDTDSRPLTPTPTVASGRTRTSAVGSMMNTRRCFTPDPAGSNTKERKQIILDLRRSHSQETLYWNASSELSPGPHPDIWTKPQPKKKSADTKKSIIKSRSASAQKPPEPEIVQKEDSQICINARDDDEDEGDQPRRRGKKRKKSKTQSATTATFHASQDPETQIATLGPDSPNLSNRPSLIPNGDGTTTVITTHMKRTNINLGDTDDGSSCFLDEESLKILRRGLNLDVVENAFEKNMNRALCEAYRTLPQDKINSESEAVKNLRISMNMPDINHDKWIKLPRKYSRSSARFELPIDSREFRRMSPIEYLSKYVSISRTRKQLYRRVFVRNLPVEPEDETAKLIYNQQVDDDSDEEDKSAGSKLHTPSKRHHIEIQERLLLITVLEIAMSEALGFHGTFDRIEEIKEILELDDIDSDDMNSVVGFNFRTWCGLIAFSERYLNRLDRDIDPPNEIELADFESLERRIGSLRISEKLENVLNIIKYN